MLTQREYLQDICDYANTILSFLEGVDFQNFKTDRKTAFAVIWAFKVIGEAVKNLAETVKLKQPQVELARLYLFSRHSLACLPSC